MTEYSVLNGISWFLLFLVVLLLIPISLSFKFDQHRTYHNEIILHWFFDLVKVRIPLQQETLSTNANKFKQSKKTAAKNRDKIAFKLLLERRFRHRLWSFISDVWHSISKQDVKFHIKAGLDDPADTGRLWAIIGPASTAIAHVHHHAVIIEPDFINAGLEIDGRGSLSCIPLQVVFITVRLFFSPILWQGLRKIHKGSGS